MPNAHGIQGIHSFFGLVDGLGCSPVHVLRLHVVLHDNGADRVDRQD